MNIISMKDVVGSDTLCGIRDHDRALGFIHNKSDLSKGWGIKISENIWQSTANNLVIPDGLVCDVEWISGYNRTSITKDIHSGADLVEEDRIKKITSIKVTGTQKGWCYEWEKGE